MKVQLKSPVFEVSEEELERLDSKDCGLGFTCIWCPFYICGRCLQEDMLEKGYTLDEVE